MVAANSEVSLNFLRAEIAGHPGIGLARIEFASRDSGFESGDLVLAPTGERDVGGPISISRLARLPRQFDTDRALVVPGLTHALWIWESVALELGEQAAYTSGSGNDRCLAQVAIWRSGRLPLRLELGASHCAAGVRAENLPIQDLQRMIASLGDSSDRSPGFAAAILSPEASAMDALLEALPTRGRVVIASAGTEASTIDFYNNVHRKGTFVTTVPSSTRDLLEPSRRGAVIPHMRRAIRILQDDELSATLASVQGPSAI